MSAGVGPGVGTATHPGMRRPVNEDHLATPPADLAPGVLARKGRLFLVADGIGGHQAGDLASRLAAEVVMQQYYADPTPDPREALERAIQAANAEIYRQAQDPVYARMGTTLVAALLQGTLLTLAHVGDSRAYLVRHRRMRALTQDHTWVAEQMRGGVLTQEQAEQHTQRHVLTRSLGTKPEVEIDTRQLELRPGDRLLLCSDGLWETVPAAEIEETVRRHPAREAAQRLVDRANAQGAPDNVTAVVIHPPAGRGGAGALRATPWRAAGLAGILALAAIVAIGGYLWSRSRPPLLTAQATTPPVGATATPGPAETTPVAALDIVEPASIGTASPTLSPTDTPAPTASVTETLTPEPAPAETATETPVPDTPTPEPTATSAEEAAVYGRVRANALSVRRVPSSQDGRLLGFLVENVKIPILCKKSGESIYGNRWWYSIVYKGYAEAYVSGYWITLEGGVLIEEIPLCTP